MDYNPPRPEEWLGICENQIDRGPSRRLGPRFDLIRTDTAATEGQLQIQANVEPRSGETFAWI